MNYTIIKKFTGFIPEDVALGHFQHILYKYEKCVLLYEEAKANLEAYLNGTKKPLEVPKYITSDVTTDGSTIYADTEMNGVRERRPVFFIGSGHFEEALADIPLFQDLGYTALQQENHSFKTIKDTFYWVKDWQRCESYATIEETTEDKKAAIIPVN